MPATDADLQVVLDAFQAFDFNADLDEYFGRYWHPEAVIESIDGFPVPGRYEGLDGYKRWFEEAYAPYEDVERRLDSIGIVGDCILALMTISGHPRDDDTELEVQTGSAYEVEDGRIKRLCVYVGHERAELAARTRR